MILPLWSLILLSMVVIISILIVLVFIFPTKKKHIPPPCPTATPTATPLPTASIIAGDYIPDLTSMTTIPLTDINDLGNEGTHGVTIDD